MEISNNYTSKTPIFVAGTPRSGTTLIARILNEHSNIFMPGETHFFDDIYSNRNILGNPSEPKNMEKILEKLSTIYSRYNEPDDQKRIRNELFSDNEFLIEIKNRCKSYKDIFTLFMEWQLRNIGKHRWGNNVPRDIFNIKEILSFFPDSKIIICVRDIRDFLASYRDRWKVIPNTHARRVKQLYHPILTSLLWKSSVSRLPKIQDLVPTGNCLTVRYEDLVGHPYNVIKDVCNFINEPFELKMLNVKFTNSSFGNSNQGIYSSSVNRWVDVLSEEEKTLAQIIGKKEMDYLGYKIYSTKPSISKTFKILLNVPIIFYRTIKVSANFRGHAILYLWRRLRSIMI